MSIVPVKPTNAPKGAGWYWWLVVLAGGLPIGEGLQYLFKDGAAQNTYLRNVLVVGQILLGLAIVGFGLYKVFRSRAIDPVDDATKLNLFDEGE